VWLDLSVLAVRLSDSDGQLSFGGVRQHEDDVREVRGGRRRKAPPGTSAVAHQRSYLSAGPGHIFGWWRVPVKGLPGKRRGRHRLGAGEGAAYAGGGGKAPVFSYMDLVRTEIALEVGERFGVTIPEEEMYSWRALGDVARSVVGQAGRKATEAEVFDWVRTLIVEGYGVSTELTSEGDVFGDYDRATAWFMALPYPYRLGDRWFARRLGTRPDGPAEPGAAPDTGRESGC
jgi:hypothetical protein